VKFVGAHVSAGGGVENAPLNAKEIGAKAFALFTKNQRQWKSRPFTEENIVSFDRNLKEVGIDRKHILPHDSYLINIGSPDREMRDKSLNALIDEAQRAEQLGLLYLNFHPGSHLNKISEQECLDLIAEGIDITLSETKNITLVIETTAGQGGNMGYKFEHIAYLIEKTKQQNRVGACIDTCHIFSAGYDIRSNEAYQKTMEEFGRIVGFEKLKGMHLNDAKVELGSKVDRHNSLGKGTLGIEPFRYVMNDPRMDDIPLILETIDPSLWAEEIKTLYSLIG